MYSKDGAYLLFSAQMYPHIGGVEAFTHHLASKLACQGRKVIVVTNNTEEICEHEIIDDLYEIYRLPCYPLISGRLPLAKRNGDYKAVFKELSRLNIVGILINTRFYDLSYDAAKFANYIGVEPILLEHGSAYLTFGNKILDFFVVMYEKYVTHRLKKYVSNFYGISTKSVEWLNNFGICAKGIISNAIDSDEFVGMSSGRNFKREFGVDEDAIVASFVGRLIPEKGIQSILKCASMMQDKNIQFVIAGDGPLKHEVESCIFDNVTYVGRLDLADVSALFLSSDLMILPSRSEGFCTTLLESSACGTCPVITDVGAVRELILNSDYGEILHDMSAESLREAIEGLIDNPERIKTCEHNIQEHVIAHFGWDNSVNMLIQTCDDANR